MESTTITKPGAPSLEEDASSQVAVEWLISWLTTVDHKRIGILYGVASLVFLLVGGVEALFMRIQLVVPENSFVSAETFNQLFTMHGTTMIFLVAMPLAVAFGNYLVPLQIGARDVAFPRLNALSLWIFLLGGLFLNSSWIFGTVPNTSWVGYAPLTSTEFSPGAGVDFWVIGLSILGIGSILGGVNFIATIINLRAPGMSMMRLPLFSWMMLVTSFIIITAMPVLAVALVLLAADRFFGANFFAPSAGGDPVLWEHLFWIFGHPEVYLLILPGFGIMSEVVPTFSRKPIFGYPVMAYSGILIGFIGWGVWAHHMFTVGMGPIADSFFVASSMIIAIPTGIKIFNWLATMWGGALRFRTAMLFAVAMILIFVIGGLSGIMHASAPVDLQQHDSYFVVAHFHYVIVGGAVTAFFAGFYYWYPKLTGRMLDETLGTWHFWLYVVGMNLTFFPMHLSGLFGMPRRVFTYQEGLGLWGWNLASTIGAFIFAAAIAVFVWNLVVSARRGKRAGPNPWGAGTLEWMTSSPPPHYNFAVRPEVRSRAPGHDEKGRATGVTFDGLPDGADEPVMPSPSWWPVLTAGAISLAWILLLTGTWWAPLIGVGLTLVCVEAWAFRSLFRE